MGLTLARYKTVLKKLLPVGKIWTFESGSDFLKLLDSFAVELKRVDDDAVTVSADVLPDVTTQFLFEWEDVLGLTAGNRSDADRRLQIVQKLTMFVAGGKKFIIDYAATKGFTITIQEFEPFVAGDYAGDTVSNGWWPFTWQMTFEGGPSDAKTDFFNFILTIKPAVTTGIIDYKDILIFDDYNAVEFDDGTFFEFGV